jgi:hypothetical protein
VIIYEADCNSNGLEDWHEIFFGFAYDDDGSLTLDECEPMVFAYCDEESSNYNEWIYAGATWIETATQDDYYNKYCQRENERLWFAFNEPALESTTFIDTSIVRRDVALRPFDFNKPFIQPQAAEYVLPEAVISAPAIMLNGRVTIPFDSRADFRFDSVSYAEFGSTSVTMIEPEARVVFNGGHVLVSGFMRLLGATLSTEDSFGFSSEFVIGDLGYFDGFGILPKKVVVAGEAVFFADTQAIGDYNNIGQTVIQNGTLTVVGDLFNSGSIIGDFSSRRGSFDFELPRSAGDGIFIRGGLTLAPSSQLSFLDSTSRVSLGGDLDSQITDFTQFNLSNAELRFVGTGDTQFVEVMSTDLGPVSQGFVPGPGSFPVGTLRMTGTCSVQLADNRDNDSAGQASAEALYVDTLVIDQGATLSNNTFMIYCRTLVNNGEVTNPANIRLVPANCPGDADQSGRVNFDDMTTVLANFGSNPDPFTSGDADGNGTVNFDDMTTVLANFGNVCN